MTISKALFSFNGRISRSDFWLKGVIILLPFGLINSVILWSNPEEPNPVSLIISIILMYPVIALYVKRLHDHNRSGWFLATMLIPIANIVFGIWIIAECWFMQGKKGSNRFGSDPLESESDSTVADKKEIVIKSSGDKDNTSGHDNNSQQLKEPDFVTMQSQPVPVNQSWYYTVNPDKKITQFVVKVPAGAVIETEFSSIMLPYDKYPIVSSQPWCSGMVKMAGKPVPFQLVRVGDFAKEVKLCDITVAFSFCQLPSSGLFLMDTRIESESFSEQVRKKYPTAPPLKKPVVEWIVSANDQFSMNMIKDVISNEKLHIVIAENSKMSSKVYSPDGNEINSIPPMAHHDRIVSFDEELRKSLKFEYDKLISHHNSIPLFKRDFGEAMYELGLLMPLEMDPVFDEPNL